MNVFFVDEDPYIAARSLCDKHVVKMILESAQMLSTAHRINDGDSVAIDNLYKATHKNHPSAVWARSSTANYNWLYEHFIGLCDEYTARYDREHLTFTKLGKALATKPNNIIIRDSIVVPPLCMPDEFKTDDHVESYRAYYNSKQKSIKMVWTRAPIPKWFKYENNDSHLQKA